MVMSDPMSLGAVDVVTREDVQALASHHGASLSIFLPTARGGAETLEGPTRLKNLVRQVGPDLADADVDANEADQLLEPVRALIDDAEFWQHQADGLAIYASSDVQRHFRVPLDFSSTAVVGSRFRLWPLWPLVAGEDTFFIVSLAQNDVRVFEATGQTISELPTGPVPNSMDDALSHEDPERQLQSRSVGGADVQFHGHGAGAEVDKATLERFFRAVDTGLNTLLGSTRQPVVLACVDYYLPIYRSVTKLANLAESVVSGNPEHRRPDELHAAARSIVQPMQAASRAAADERFAARAGSGGTLTSLPEIVEAAGEGRVQTLLVRSTPSDTDGGAHTEMNALVDRAVADVLSTGGEIDTTTHVIPTDGPVAAILRY